MLAIFALAALATTLSLSMKVETHLAVTANDDQKMIWLARSAVENARYGLVMETKVNQPYRSENQWWATGEAGPNETNTVLVNYPQSWPNSLSIDWQPSSGAFTYKIIDLDRYININTASAPLLQQVFNYFGAGADDISVASDSIQDWVQAGDSPRIAGAKNEYYQSLDPPYSCKEAPMDNISELMLVHGIQNGDTNPVVGFHHQLGFGNSMGQGNALTYQELAPVFTPFSSGQINVNTADLDVLAILTDGDTNAAQTIIDYRNGANNDNILDPSIKSLSQLTAAGISQQAIQKLGPYCTVNSTVFRVDVTASIGQDTRHFHAILFQQGGKVDIVNFYSDD